MTPAAPIPVRCSAGATRSRRGLTMIEVIVVALIAGGAAIYILSLGQANVQLSQINSESILARQIALDVVEYYSHNFAEAKALASTVSDFREVFEAHAAFRDTLELSESTRQLYEKMAPSIYLRLHYNVEVPTGSGTFYPGLHRLIAVVDWTEGSTAHKPRRVVVSRLISEG